MTLTRTRLAVVTVLAILLAAVLSAAQLTSPSGSMLPKAEALGKVKCDLTKSGSELNWPDNVSTARAAIDPIVYHNQTGNAHVHDFFGGSWLKGVTGEPHWVTAKGNTVNYSDLTNTKTSCRIPGDTAGYWTPALKYISGPKAGQYVPVTQFTAYYRGFAGQSTHAGSQAPPADVRLVANDDSGYGLSGWTCGQNSAVTGGQNSIPNCSASDGGPGDQLTAHINYPSCWNGNAPNHSNSEVGDTRDNADFVYPTNKTSCPSSHPIEIAQLRQTVQYAYYGAGADGTNVALTSDGTGGDGTSMHGDFWNTWNQSILTGFIRKCVQGLSATTYTGSCDV
jgi:hypothetical protein